MRFLCSGKGRGGKAMVYEDAVVLAFLYNRPLFPEHVLLVPREPVETLAARMLGRSTIG